MVKNKMKKDLKEFLKKSQATLHFKVRCPVCHRIMIVEVRGSPYLKRHTCPFCRKNFAIHKNPSDTQIIKII